jgi:serine-type D-Ala-D-Ala carboxypeptidase (penicillin-binding protein 5/6)
MSRTIPVTHAFLPGKRTTVAGPALTSLRPTPDSRAMPDPSLHAVRRSFPNSRAPLLAWSATVVVALAAIVFASIEPARAQSAPPALTTKARQAILIDAESGAMLFQHNADERMSPASMSKLMTLALIFKALKAGDVKLDTEFLMTVGAWRKGGAPSGTSAMFVPVGTREPLERLLQGIVVESGNDAAIAVAEGLAGSEPAFARAMTEEAQRLGMRKSTFANATGLYAPDHLTTARDLAILARHLIREYPDHYPRFSQKEFQYRKHLFRNRNPLLGSGIGVDGLKTGSIKESGFGIVASAKQDNRRLILVINGLERQEDRKTEAIRLLEWGFKNFTEFRLFDADEVVGSARVWGGNRMYVPLTGNGAVNVILARTPANPRLKAEIVYKGPLKTPINRGDQIATLRVSTGGQTINELPLYAAEGVESGGVLKKGVDSLLHMMFRWLL